MLLQYEIMLYSDDTINLGTAAQMLAGPAILIAHLQQGTVCQANHAGSSVTHKSGPSSFSRARGHQGIIK